MNPIDANFCVTVLRDVTDKVAARFTPPAAGLGLAAIIGEIRSAANWAEEAMRAPLEVRFPGVAWAGESSGPTDALNLPYWICDPIDGAYHYAQGLPLWSSSLALVHHGRPVFSIVYDPTMREVFVGVAGTGATLNGEKLVVSGKPSLDTAVLATAVPPAAAVAPEMQEAALVDLGKIARHAFVVRQMASASLQLAYVAARRLDGYWEHGDDLDDWLAGALLVQEAGGIVTDLTGLPFGRAKRGILAAPPQLHEPLLEALR